MVAVAPAAPPERKLAKNILRRRMYLGSSPPQIGRKKSLNCDERARIEVTSRGLVVSYVGRQYVFFDVASLQPSLGLT